MVSPIIDEIGRENESTLKVGKVNVDEQAALAGEFSILAIPTLLVFEKGILKNRASGIMLKENILALLGE